MSLKQRGEVWHVCIAAPDGTLIRRSTGTKDRRQAQEYHDKLKAGLWRVKQLGERPSRTWDEAALKWLQETEHKDTHLEDVAKIRWLTTHFRGKQLPLTRDEVSAVTSSKSNSTANRYTALVRAIMNRARNEWGWFDNVPKYHMRKEPKRRIRNLTREQVAKLLELLPEHQRNITIFALATGLRQSNVLRLTWDMIDLQNKIAVIPDTKNGEPLGVPLSDKVVDFLERLPKSGATNYVFTYRGKRLKQVNTKCFQRAVLGAGIQDFRWHDLRHVWACWHVQDGTPLFALQEMAGWKSESMVRRYAHLSPEHLLQYTKATEVHI